MEISTINLIKLRCRVNYIHMISGGLDSTYSLMALTNDLIKEKKQREVVHPIFFDYGQQAAEWEYKYSIKVVDLIIEQFNSEVILTPPICICLKSQLFHWCKNVAYTGKEVGDRSCEIQNRNIVLISILASYLFACAENQNISSTKFEIYSGFKDGEMEDCKKEFFDKFTDLLAVYKPNYKLNINVLPEMRRQKVIGKMKKLLKGSEIKLKLFKTSTISCYAPKDGKPCGSCWKCKSLKEEKVYSHRYGSTE